MPKHVPCTPRVVSEGRGFTARCDLHNWSGSWQPTRSKANRSAGAHKRAHKPRRRAA
jgi:hypothetical protein